MEHLDPDGPISLAPVAVDARSDGMVSMMIEDVGVVGTWMDALVLSHTLLAAARSASLSIDVPDGVFTRQMIRTALRDEDWE